MLVFNQVKTIPNIFSSPYKISHFIFIGIGWFFLKMIHPKFLLSSWQIYMISLPNLLAIHLKIQKIADSGWNRVWQNLCYLAKIWTIADVVISNRYQPKTKPHLFEKWGLNIQSMATSWSRVIFQAFLYALWDIRSRFWVWDCLRFSYRHQQAFVTLLSFLLAFLHRQSQFSCSFLYWIKFYL